jgi:hypothetical protein
VSATVSQPGGGGSDDDEEEANEEMDREEKEEFWAVESDRWGGSPGGWLHLNLGGGDRE